MIRSALGRTRDATPGRPLVPHLDWLRIVLGQRRLHPLRATHRTGHVHLAEGAGDLVTRPDQDIL